jgi:hypothetical protein
MNLVSYLQSRGEGLDKDCLIIRHAIRHKVQIANCQCQIVRERAVMPIDADRASMSALTGNSLPAEITGVVGYIDFSNDTLTDPIRLGNAFNHLTNKFMTEYALKPHIPVYDFKIGIAYPCPSDADKCLITGGDGQRIVGLK